MNPQWIARVSIVVAAVSGGADDAVAERGEWAAGASSGLVLPAVDAQDQTAFRLVTWGVAVQGRYGVFDDLDLRASVGWARFSGEVAETRMLGRDIVGARVFTAQQFAVSVGARFKLLAGYDVAPYLEGDVGYQWSIFTGQDFRDPATNRSYGLDLADEADGALALTLGVAVDLRIFDLFFAGLAVRFTELFGAGLYERYVSVPLELSVYW